MGHNKLAAYEASQMEGLARELPDFRPGDTVVVHSRITEGDRQRIQQFEGVVLGRRHRGYHSSFTVRKVAHGVGVERIFFVHSPLVEKVEIKKRGLVRRSKLYYLRALSGRAARIQEKLVRKTKNHVVEEVAPSPAPEA